LVGCHAEIDVDNEAAVVTGRHPRSCRVNTQQVRILPGSLMEIPYLCLHGAYMKGFGGRGWPG